MMLSTIQERAMQSEGERENELPQPKTASGSPSAKPSDARHTPGPWTIEPNIAGRGAWIGHDGGRWSALALGSTDAEALANAALIAAAPDLLKVAKQQAASYFRICVRGGEMREGYECLECHHEVLGPRPDRLTHDPDCELANAIAKAKGDTQS
jgi:hypothetical protein